MALTLLRELTPDSKMAGREWEADEGRPVQAGRCVAQTTREARPQSKTRSEIEEGPRLDADHKQLDSRSAGAWRGHHLDLREQGAPTREHPARPGRDPAGGGKDAGRAGKITSHLVSAATRGGSPNIRTALHHPRPSAGGQGLLRSADRPRVLVTQPGARRRRDLVQLPASP